MRVARLLRRQRRYLRGRGGAGHLSTGQRLATVALALRSGRWRRTGGAVSRLAATNLPASRGRQALAGAVGGCRGAAIAEPPAVGGQEIAVAVLDRRRDGVDIGR